VVDRRDVGSWLQGPGSVNRAQTGEYAGQRLGLPPAGPGSIAKFGRRLLAIIVDWALCQAIAVGLLHVPPPWGGGPQGFVPLVVFAVENLLLVGTLGFTVGHRLLGLHVVSLTGRRLTIVQAAIRTLLLCLAVPALIWDRDGRGMHDRFADTAIVRR
jgi:uncharacterized RDD family membrane protein YckC